MQALSDQLKRFQDMKWSEIIEGRKQDILQWVIGNPEERPEVDPNATAVVSTTTFRFNTTLLRPYFEDLSHDPDTLPFIEFSAIGLLRVPSDIKKPEELLPYIQKLRNADEPYNELEQDYQDIPLIIAMGARYFLHGNTNGSLWNLIELDAKFLSSRNLHFTDIPFYLEYNLQHYPIYHHIIEKNGHTHFSTQAQQISKIKQIINSTFYISALLREAEGLQINVTGLFSLGSAFINYINGTTYDNIYRAITLLANTEIDFAHRFQDEVGEFLQILDRFTEMSTTIEHVAPPPPPLPGVYNPTNSFQLGHAGGFVTRYIYDENGQWDIDVLSQFSADLPRHIDLLTTLINANNSTVIQYAPNINAAQLRALQKEATQLLKTLKNTQNNANRSKFNPLYQMYQIINYTFLLRQIIVLLSTTLNQVGQLNEAYQESLRDMLSILQDDFFSLLVHYADHAEIELVLDSGTLSGPTTRTIHACNRYLAEHIRSLANFSFLGEELLTIQHSGFLKQREAAIQSLAQNCLQTQQQIRWAQQALPQFFANLDSPTSQEQYAWLAPYVQKMNPVLNRTISRALTASSGDHNVANALTKEDLQLLRCQLAAYLTKLRNTEALRLQQCEAVLLGVQQSTQLQLLPYTARTGCEIALKNIKNRPLDSLVLPTEYPILIKHRMASETKYVFYGNTDGSKWGFTPIAEAFIHPHILARFESPELSDPKRQHVYHILHYRIKYHSLYQQMILRKAHTHYISQLSMLESDALAKPESVTTLVSRPIIWAYQKWQNQASVGEPNTNPTPNTPLPTITRGNEDWNYYPDLHELSIDQIWTLYGWYQNKIANYHQAERNLLRFQALIQQNFPSGAIHFVEKSSLLQECQYLYHAVRPYLIGIRNFPEFDQNMVSALSISIAGQPPKTAISYPELERYLASFPRELAQDFLTKWQERAAQLLKHAKHILRHQNEQALIQRRGSFTALPREGFLLKSNQISTKIKAFHDALQKWTPILNSQIQSQLQLKKSNGRVRYPNIHELKDQLSTHSAALRQLQANKETGDVPYSDITNLKDQLRHPPFVLFFKRLFNAAHHLEHIAVSLEEIRTGNTSDIKNETTQLIIKVGMNHAQALLDIGIQLRDDRVLSEICQDAYQQYSDILQKIMNLAKPYTADVKKVSPAFSTLPTHLLSAPEQKHLNLGYGMHLRIDRNPKVATPTTKTLTLIQHTDQYYIYSGGRDNNWQLHSLPRDVMAVLPIDFSEAYLNYDHRCQPLYDYLLQKNYHFSHLGVTYPGLWYLMNVLYTLPTHLLSITEQKHLNLGYGMRLIIDTNADVTIPTTKTLTLILHRDHYYIYSGGRDKNWQLRPLPHDMMISLPIDFNEEYWNYDHRCQPLYDYLLQKNYHFTYLNEQQIAAKRATQNIEQIIRDSNHYFKLFFFDGPMIYQCNQNFWAQLETFTKTTQEVALSHLSILQSDYFAPMMVKADTKEHEWGLRAGALTESLDAIQNELFQGIIFPLKKSFPEKVAFCTSDIILKTRITAEEARLVALSVDNVERQTEINTVASFAHDLRDFVTRALTYMGQWSQEPVPDSLVTRYTTYSYPKLLKYRNTFIPAWIENIPASINRENLPAIIAQIIAYHTRLARLSLLHNTHDRKICEALPIFLTQLENLLRTPASTPIPGEVIATYVTLIAPELHKHRQSFIPGWLKEISAILDRNTMSAILDQTETYAAYLEGLAATQVLSRALSTEKLAYLQDKLVQHEESSTTQYGQSFAKHYFHTYVNRLPYKASGLAHMHREYHRELKIYLLQQETTFLAPLTEEDDVDTVLNQKFQEKITEFNQRYFERFLRFDRLQIAINTFKDYIAQEPHFPKKLRNDKIQCLNDIEKILHERRGDSDMEAFLNLRSQSLQNAIESRKKKLLETHPQFNTVLDWLIDCVFSLFVALGLATPTSQIHYADLVNADNPHPNLPKNWLNFMTFRPTAPNTPPRGGAQIVTEQTPARVFPPS